MGAEPTVILPGADPELWKRVQEALGRAPRAAPPAPKPTRRIPAPSPRPTAGSSTAAGAVAVPPPVGSEILPHATPEERAYVLRRVAELARERGGPLTGPRRAIQLASLLAAYRHGRVGNKAWGRRMLAMRAVAARRRKQAARKAAAAAAAPDSLAPPTPDQGGPHARKV